MSPGSTLDPTAESHLRRALRLAEEAAALASPNPAVGCVLALGDHILGEGAHLYDHFDHAEIVALNQAATLGHNVRGATACVSLEPCAHHGRTPPCSNALIAAGISRCVIATVDPNPLVRGQGITKLRAAGIEVVVLEPASPLAQQARTLNDAFAFSIQHHRPFVTLKAAVSLDGYLAPPPATRSVREPFWLTGEAARADVLQLRHNSDAILTGIGTILADNPSLTDRTGLPRRRPLLRVILDSDLRTPHSAHLFPAQDDLLIICSGTASIDSGKALANQGAEILRLPTGIDGRPELTVLLKELGERRILSLLLEAGTHLNDAFLSQNLIDKVVLYYADLELGENAVKFANRSPSPYKLQENLACTSRTAFPHGNSEDIRLTGYLHNPWTGIETVDI